MLLYVNQLLLITYLLSGVTMTRFLNFITGKITLTISSYFLNSRGLIVNTQSVSGFFITCYSVVRAIVLFGYQFHFTIHSYSIHIDVI